MTRRTDVIAGAWRRRLSIASLSALVAVLTVVVSSSPAFASAYSSAVLADSPEAYWTLNGTLADASGNGHTATWQGASAFCTDHVVTGDVSTFCGSGSSSIFGGATLTAGYPMTVEYWVKATDHSNTQTMVLAYSASGCPRVEITIDSGTNNTGYSGCGPNGPNSSGCAGGAGWTGTAWHLFDVIYNASSIDLYMDGAYCSTQAGSGLAAFTANDSTYGVHVGGRVSDRFAVSGTHISQVALYTHALTGSRIAAHYGALAGGPAAQLLATASPTAVKVGESWTVTLTSTDSFGSDVTGTDSYQWRHVYFNPPGGSVTCGGFTETATSSPYAATFNHAVTGHTITCSAPQAGIVNLGFTSTTVGSTNETQTSVDVGQAPSQFSITGPDTGVLGQRLSYRNMSFKANYATGVYTDVSGSDSWTIDSAAHQSCSVPLPIFQPLGASPSDYYGAVCSWDLGGSYTIVAHDSYGFTAQKNVTISGPSTASTCGSTDLGCWLNQLWDSITALAQIPGQILDGLYSAFFVSRSGKSYLDTSALTSTALLPAVDCRSGQAATAPDGIHCLPFPFSIPYDATAIVNLLAVSPTAPSFSLSWDFHFMGSTIHTSHDFDISTLLTDTMMGYIRNAELVIFIIGTALGTWRILQLVGVG